jgi:predicted HicB family RNase H-like nuclease
MGRPKKPLGTKVITVTFGVRLTPAEAQSAALHAKNLGMTRNRLVAELLRKETEQTCSKNSEASVIA